MEKGKLTQSIVGGGVRTTVAPKGDPTDPTASHCIRRRRTCVRPCEMARITVAMALACVATTAHAKVYYQETFDGT